MYLTDQFIAQYENKVVPFGGNGLGNFVYLRTYARWLEDKQRREHWYETVRRVVEYSLSLYQGPSTACELQQEAEQLFDAMFHMRVFPAGRTLWIGGTENAKLFPLSNFNCSFVVVNRYSAFVDTFHALMLGTGVGFRVFQEDVNKLAAVNPTIVLAHKPYHPKEKKDRIEQTQVYEGDNSVYIIVGDSKAGWTRALEEYFTVLQRKDIEAIIINYDSVRPAGERLKTFGGRASGHTALRDMFNGVHKVIRSGNTTLTPLQCMDIMNFIGQNVVSGGVRRTSEITLFGIDETDVLDAKVGLFDTTHKNYAQHQRYMSNNSILFKEKPTKAQLAAIFDRINQSAEPGFINYVEMNRRRHSAEGLNPCAEIILDDCGTCNLCEVNLAAHVVNGELDFSKLAESMILATRMGLRMTNVTIELTQWDFVQKRDRLLGISLGGVITAEEMLGYTVIEKYGLSQQFVTLIDTLNEIANTAAKNYAFEMRVPIPLLVTTEKPSGSISQLPTISSGVHRDYAPFYIRRVRITASDPLAKVVLAMGYPVYPETGQGPSVHDFDQLSAYDKMQALEVANTWVVEFPVQSPVKLAAVDESAVQQLARYFTFQRNYTDHNTSITVYYDVSEVAAIIDMLYENWNDYVGVSFLPRDNSIYPLLPKEKINAEEYHYRASQIKTNDIMHTMENLLKDTERSFAATELLDADCDGGICPIR